MPAGGWRPGDQGRTQGRHVLTSALCLALKTELAAYLQLSVSTGAGWGVRPNYRLCACRTLQLAVVRRQECLFRPRCAAALVEGAAFQSGVLQRRAASDGPVLSPAGPSTRAPGKTRSRHGIFVHLQLPWGFPTHDNKI